MTPWQVSKCMAAGSSLRVLKFYQVTELSQADAPLWAPSCYAAQAVDLEQVC